MKRIFMIFATIALGFSVLFATAPVFAANDASKKAACEAIGATYDSGTGKCSDGSPKSQPQDLISEIITIFSWVVGAISVIMLIFAGFKYVTSGGDAGKITSAKNTIIYALIGLVVVALSQTLVIFVLKKTNCATNPTSSQCK